MVCSFSEAPKMDPMRVLLITGSFPPMRCGVGDYTARLAEAIGRVHGTSVAVLTSQVAGMPTLPNSRYEVFPVVSQWSLRYFPRIARLVRRWQPDIVHMQFPTQGYRVGYLPLLLPSLLFPLNLKVVQTWHEYYTKDNITVGLLPNMLIPGGLIAVRPHYLDHLPGFHRRLIRFKRFRFIPMLRPSRAFA